MAMAAAAVAWGVAAAVLGAGARVRIAPGVDMPLINNGPDPFEEAPNATRDLARWFAAGGEGIDTAYSYKNQKEFGDAVRAAQIPRGRIFLTTKIPCTGSADSALANAQEDLKELALPYVDLLIIHTPRGCDDAQLQQTYHGLELALAQNLTRAIGVSNFGVGQLQTVLASATIPPAVNQCEMYVGHHDDATITFCKQHSIVYEAYSPLGPWNQESHQPKPVLSNPVVLDVAAAHNATAAQVGMAWIAQQGLPLVTASSSETYDRQDLAAAELRLTDGEMARLSAAKK